MKKDFDKWNKEKKRIQSEEGARLYNEREIWWCSVGVNVGSEQDGTGKGFQRPVLILRGMSKDTCLIIPLSASGKRHKLRVPIGKVGGRAAVALMSQIRIIDVKRLANKIGYLETKKFEEVRKIARDLL